MGKIVAAVCGLFLITIATPALSEEQQVEVVPAVMLSSSDLKELKEVNFLLHQRQSEVEKIMDNEGVKVVKPQLPNYTPLIDNSVQALLNQVNYIALAEKIGAAIPPRPDLETGIALKNNRFLHFYNNAILRSIAKKWDVETPELVDLTKGDIEDQCFSIVKQNSEIVHRILVKRGLAG
ncbi:MAG: hypothetical protein K2W95_20875 [Candidatus Obscuribacterales bacterium]|nr:hypothetical protein [Candidatus Obscuribacterales bacterium]